MEEDHCWKTTFIGKGPLVEDDLEPNIDPNIEPNILIPIPIPIPILPISRMILIPIPILTPIPIPILIPIPKHTLHLNYILCRTSFRTFEIKCQIFPLFGPLSGLLQIDTPAKRHSSKRHTAKTYSVKRYSLIVIRILNPVKSNLGRCFTYKVF